MKKILVPMDFSPSSRHAAEHAMMLAKALGVNVELLHIYMDPVPATVGGEPLTATVSSLRELKEARMLEEVNFLSNRYGSRVTGELRLGFRVHTIRKLAKEDGVEMIVLGLKDASKITDNVISKIVRRTHKPVLVVPENAPLADFRKIVLAMDFSYLPEKGCFEPLFSIIKAFEASLNVIHVEGRGSDESEDEMSAKLEIGRRLSKVSFVYDKLENDEIGMAVLEYTQSHPTNMLVMVARHHPFAWRDFLANTIKTILQNSNLPVLILAGEQ